MKETLNIVCKEMKLTLTDSKEIKEFFTSFTCPLCKESLLKTTNINDHQVKYSVKEDWNIKQEGVDFHDVSQYFGLNSEDIIAGLSSGLYIFQRIARNMILCRNINFISFTESNQESYFDTESKDIKLHTRNSRILYHEIGHALYHTMSQFTKRSLRCAFNQDKKGLKKKIDNYFDKTFNLSSLRVFSALEGTSKGKYTSLLNNLYMYLYTHYYSLIDLSDSLKTEDDQFNILGSSLRQDGYWNDDTELDELFASLFSVYALDDYDNIDLFFKFLPKTLQVFSKIINQLK